MHIFPSRRSLTAGLMAFAGALSLTVAVAPQGASAAAPQQAQFGPPAAWECGFPPAAPKNYSVTCGDVTHYSGYQSTAYYYRATCYSFWYSNSLGHSGQLITSCRPSYG